MFSEEEEIKILGTSKITRRFQVTIIKEVRELLKIKIGDILVFEKHGDKVIIRRG
ncbi:MAG: AbrB/MazE/SpoVT family DNA-binding domain-containing protein [archaeon GB-1867-005]|nr:AbrB/MazE/SpoVT family DNA-binding domain-containing protein [Candidatus Culexmicrobium cathedralense]